MINKHKFHINANHKVLHKHGKRWIVLSAMLLSLIVGGSAVSSSSVSANVKTPNMLSTIATKTSTPNRTSTAVSTSTIQNLVNSVKSGKISRNYINQNEPKAIRRAVNNELRGGATRQQTLAQHNSDIHQRMNAVQNLVNGVKSGRISRQFINQNESKAMRQAVNDTLRGGATRDQTLAQHNKDVTNRATAQTVHNQHLAQRAYIKGIKGTSKDPAVIAHNNHDKQVQANSAHQQHLQSRQNTIQNLVNGVKAGKISKNYINQHESPSIKRAVNTTLRGGMTPEDMAQKHNADNTKHNKVEGVHQQHLQNRIHTEKVAKHDRAMRRKAINDAIRRSQNDPAKKAHSNHTKALAIHKAHLNQRAHTEKVAKHNAMLRRKAINTHIRRTSDPAQIAHNNHAKAVVQETKDNNKRNSIIATHKQHLNQEAIAQRLHNAFLKHQQAVQSLQKSQNDPAKRAHAQKASALATHQAHLQNRIHTEKVAKHNRAMRRKAINDAIRKSSNDPAKRAHAKSASAMQAHKAHLASYANMQSLAKKQEASIASAKSKAMSSKAKPTNGSTTKHNSSHPANNNSSKPSHNNTQPTNPTNNTPISPINFNIPTTNNSANNNVNSLSGTPFEQSLEAEGISFSMASDAQSLETAPSIPVAFTDADNQSTSDNTNHSESVIVPKSHKTRVHRRYNHIKQDKTDFSDAKLYKVNEKHYNREAVVQRVALHKHHLVSLDGNWLYSNVLNDAHQHVATIRKGQRIHVLGAFRVKYRTTKYSYLRLEVKIGHHIYFMTGNQTAIKLFR